ncbi:MAG: hypothetical protein NT141_03945 [candidate division WWE3 bacterium]|nr:hypothetical protein [candidate division WWE3 bacterium]
MYEKALKESGLRDKEALLYSVLLQSGVSPVGDVIKKSGLKRGIVYKTLYDLEEKGLVSQVTIKKRLHFRPEHPFKLADIIENRLKEAKNSEVSLQTYLPELISAFKTTENKPGVKIYEGLEGIKAVYEDTIKEQAEIWAILQTEDVDPKVYAWLTKVYAVKRSKAKVWAKVIVAEDAKTKTYTSRDEAEQRETRVVPKDKFPVGIEVDIYGDKVAFINFHAEKDLMAIIVQNALIAQTMRALFALAWDQAGSYNTPPRTP